MTMLATRRPRAVLIAGPTASGKSALAVAVARRLGGVVVNADSMQVYDGLRILTARPSAEEEREVPHRLYGHVDPALGYSVAEWLDDARKVIQELHVLNQIPVFVGGTGLYFESLANGLSPVPDVPEEIRLRWRSVAAAEGAAALAEALASLDPVMAARLVPTDTQRMTRALEVVEATGRSLADWQAMPHSMPLVSAEEAVRIVLEPERAVLHERIARRFHAMVAEGGVDEADAFVRRGLAGTLPAMRAIGVGVLASVASGEVSLEEGIERGIVETRQYAKRQSTWFRGRMGGWLRGTAEELEEAAVAQFKF